MITLVTCRNDLEVQLCMNALIVHDIGEASTIEVQPTAHEVVSAHASKLDTYAVVIPDGVYSERRVEQLQSLLEGVTWTLRTPFYKKVVEDFKFE